MDAAQGAYERKLAPLVVDSSVAGVRRLRRAMAEQGLLGLNSAPPSMAASAFHFLKHCLVIQTLQACAPIVGGLCHRTSTGAVGAVAEYGTPEQRVRFVEPLCRGEIGISIGITEPDAGSAATALKTRAHIDGDHVVLNGLQAVRQLREHQ